MTQLSCELADHFSQLNANIPDRVLLVDGRGFQISHATLVLPACSFFDYKTEALQNPLVLSCYCLARAIIYSIKKIVRKSKAQHSPHCLHITIWICDRFCFFPIAFFYSVYLSGWVTKSSLRAVLSLQCILLSFNLRVQLKFSSSSSSVSGGEGVAGVVPSCRVRKSTSGCVRNKTLLGPPLVG